MEAINKEISDEKLVHVLYQHSFLKTTEYKLSKDYLEITELRSLNFNKSKIPLENIDPQETIRSSISKSALISLFLFSFIIAGVSVNLYQQELNSLNIIPLLILSVVSLTGLTYLILTKNIQYIFTDNITQDELFTLNTDKDKLHKLNSFILVLKEKIKQKHSPTNFDKFAMAAKLDEIKIEDQPLYHLNELQNLGILDNYLYNRIKKSISDKLAGNDPIIIKDNVINFSAIKK